MKLVYATVIYDSQFYKKFVVDYLSSLNEQTDTDFHLLLILDDVDNLAVEPYLNSYYSADRDVTVVQTDAIYSPYELRKFMISKAYELSADGLIFSDFDETVAANRVEEVKKYIADYDFVFNDFFVTDENLQRMSDLSFFSKRKINNVLRDWECIRDFNFVGLGSMAINLNNIDFSVIEFPEDIKALDWFLATWILLNGGVGFKLASTFVNYRQHADSYVGFNKKLDKKSLLFGLEVKKSHYEFFLTNSPLSERNKFDELYRSTIELESRVINTRFLDDYIREVNNDLNYDTFCWWENIKLLEDENANI